MALAQWISIIILAVYPVIFPAASYFFRVPEMQRETLKFYAPIAAKMIDKSKIDADIHLAVAFVAKSFWKHRLWPLPEEQVIAAIRAELT
jgi:hypothetical protein